MEKNINIGGEFYSGRIGEILTGVYIISPFNLSISFVDLSEFLILEG